MRQLLLKKVIDRQTVISSYNRFLGSYEIRKLTGDLYIRYRMDNISQYLLICFFAIAIGMGLILYSLLANAFRKLFLKKGEIVPGVIYDVETVIQTRIAIGDTYNDFRKADKVTVRFTTKKQEWITADLDRPFWWIIGRRGLYRQGERVLVIYQPGNPYNFEIVRLKTSETEKIVFAIAGLVFIAVGIYFLITAPGR